MLFHTQIERHRLSTVVTSLLLLVLLSVCLKGVDTLKVVRARPKYPSFRRRQPASPWVLAVSCSGEAAAPGAV